MCEYVQKILSLYKDIKIIKKISDISGILREINYTVIKIKRKVS